MFHFGMTELSFLAFENNLGCISLTQQLFIVHYLCLGNLKASVF